MPKKMSLVLLGFISNWCEQHQPAMRCRSSVIFTWQEFMFLTEKEQQILVSSMYIVGIGTASLTAEGRSFI